jgi:hypothetical protein
VSVFPTFSIKFLFFNFKNLKYQKDFRIFDFRGRIFEKHKKKIEKLKIQKHSNMQKIQKHLKNPKGKPS